MSKTFEINEITGEHVPSKSRRKIADRKDFGHSYPFDTRPRAVKKAIDDRNRELNELSEDLPLTF